MNRSIYKYPLSYVDEQEVEFPLDWEFLSLQMQNGVPCIWAKVHPKQKLRKRETIIMMPTGGNRDFEGLRYLATVQQGPLVWHFFLLVTS